MSTTRSPSSACTRGGYGGRRRRVALARWRRACCWRTAAPCGDESRPPGTCPVTRARRAAASAADRHDGAGHERARRIQTGTDAERRRRPAATRTTLTIGACSRSSTVDAGACRACRNSPDVVSPSSSPSVIRALIPNGERCAAIADATTTSQVRVSRDTSRSPWSASWSLRSARRGRGRRASAAAGSARPRSAGMPGDRAPGDLERCEPRARAVRQFRCAPTGRSRSRRDARRGAVARVSRRV